MNRFPCLIYYSFCHAMMSLAQVRDLWEEFYSNADAVVFMVDSADKPRFDEAKAEIYQILESEDLKSVPILVLGNKNDLEASYVTSFFEYNTN